MWRSGGEAHVCGGVGVRPTWCGGVAVRPVDGGAEVHVCGVEGWG